MWYDTEATFTAILAALRLAGSDVDGDRIRALIPTAAALIDQYLDRDPLDPLPGPPPPAAVQTALEQATVELYSRKSSASVAFAPGVGSYAERYVNGDPLGELFAVLLPHKQRWGLA